MAAPRAAACTCHAWFPIPYLSAALRPPPTCPAASPCFHPRKAPAPRLALPGTRPAPTLPCRPSQRSTPARPGVARTHTGGVHARDERTTSHMLTLRTLRTRTAHTTVVQQGAAAPEGRGAGAAGRGAAHARGAGARHYDARWLLASSTAAKSSGCRACWTWASTLGARTGNRVIGLGPGWGRLPPHVRTLPARIRPCCAALAAARSAWS